MNNFKVLLNGIVKENPTFVLLLGMCPTLGTTSSAINGMSMGLATTAVLIFSNIIVFYFVFFTNFLFTKFTHST